MIDVVLSVVEGRLEARDAGTAPGRGLSVDFLRSGPDLRTGSGSLSRKQPLARAIGAAATTVADATVGLGHDAVLLAALGYEIVAIERSEPVAAVVADALERAASHERLAPIVARITLRRGDAREVLPTLDPRPEVVYVDPMFPPKRKRSALPKKEIQWLQQLVGEDADAAELVEVAAAVATRRAVVKRPTHAGPLRPDPSLQFAGKLARYDVYLP
jgi:16S rRNA (guanine1516-N2)-methyltransferase